MCNECKFVFGYKYTYIFYYTDVVSCFLSICVIPILYCHFLFKFTVRPKKFESNLLLSVRETNAVYISKIFQKYVNKIKLLFI